MLVNHRFFQEGTGNRLTYQEVIPPYDGYYVEPEVTKAADIDEVSDNPLAQETP